MDFRIFVVYISERGVRSMDDCKIVELYFARDERAISATAEKYGKYCAAVARNILINEEDTEECVNDTWLRAWNAIPPHRPKRLSVFLGKITRNLAFNRYKHDRRDKRGGGETDTVLEELWDCIPDEEGIEQNYERRELTEAINAFLRSLTGKQRDIFVRRYWYTDSVEGIAERWETTADAVSMILKRLRIKLKNYLTERGYEI